MSLNLRNDGKLFLDGVMVGTLEVVEDDANHNGRGMHRVKLVARGVVVDEGDSLSKTALDTSIGGSGPAPYRLDEMDQREAADNGWTSYTAETFLFPVGFKAGDRVKDYMSQAGTVVVPPSKGSGYPGGNTWSVPVAFDYNDGKSISWTDAEHLEVIS